MQRTLITCLATLAALIALPAPTTAALFSATGPIIAIMAGDLFLGEAQGNIDGSGTLALRSRSSSRITCHGQFAKKAESSGAGNMACSDGATAAFEYQRLSLLRGHGSGNTSRGAMTFTYGLSVADSEPYLKLPPGKVLKLVGKEPELVDHKQTTRAPATLTGALGSVPEIAPDALISAATSIVTANLKQDKDLTKSGSSKLAELLESTILPLFDFPHMTRLALARHWRIASAEQQSSLVNEFRTLLVRTYSTALRSYRNQAIDYKPLRMAPGDASVTVRSTVNQPGSERLSIDYDMSKTAAGWKVYDVKVAGVSLITTYRSTFAETVVDGGVEGLINSLVSKNRLAEAGINAIDIGNGQLLFIYSAIPGMIRFVR